MRSYESEPPPARAPRAALAFPVLNQIQRTIRVDVDVERDAMAGDTFLKKKKKEEEEEEERGKGKGKKPSIEIDLGPRFEIQFESLRRDVCGAGTLSDARAGGGGGGEGEGERPRQGSESESENT